MNTFEITGILPGGPVETPPYKSTRFEDDMDLFRESELHAMYKDKVDKYNVYDYISGIEPKRAKPSKDQQKWIDHTLALLTGNQRKGTSGACTLYGGAGSGKTFTVNALIDKLEDRGVKVKKLAFSAAAARLIHGSTIHKYLDLKKVDDMTNLDLDFKPGMNSKIINYDCIIVDESSQLSQGLLDTLLNCTRAALYIFVGDDKQIEAIGKKADLSRLESYELTGSQRIKNEDIRGIIEAAAKNTKEDFGFNYKDYLNDSVIEVTRKEAYAIHNAIKDEDKTKNRFISFNHNTLEEYLENIDNPMDEYSNHNTMMSLLFEDDLKFYGDGPINGEEIVLKKVALDIIPDLRKKFELEYGLGWGGVGPFNMTLNKVYDDAGVKLQGYIPYYKRNGLEKIETGFRDFRDQSERVVEFPYIFAVSHTDKEKLKGVFDKAYKELSDKIRAYDSRYDDTLKEKKALDYKARTKEDSNNVNHYLLSVTREAGLSQEYEQMIKIRGYVLSAAEVKPLVVMTSHRSQGQTLNGVFVDKQLFNCEAMKKNSKNLYVALSRASEKIYLVD